MANFSLDQVLPVTIEPKQRNGQPATLDGVPVWASSDETIVTVVAAADGLSATIDSVTPGDARVSVSGDADLGEGVKPIVGTIDVTVTAGSARTITVVAGAASDKPD